MHLECLGLREPLPTTFTSEPTLGFVYKDMPLHVGLKREGPATHGAWKRFHGAVSDKMIAEVVLLHEAHATVRACKTAHLRMHQHVVPQLTRILE